MEEVSAISHQPPESMRTMVMLRAVPGEAFAMSLAEVLASSADYACIDLENVNEDFGGETACEFVIRNLIEKFEASPDRLIVRVNPLATWRGLSEIVRIRADAELLAGIVLPQVKSAGEVAWLGEVLDSVQSHLKLFPIIESASGLVDCGAIALAHPRVRALFFGGNDLSAALGCDMDWNAMSYARSKVVAGAALGGIPAIDCPPAPDQDFESDCLRSRKHGMSGRALRVPSDCAVANRIYSRSKG